MRIQRFEDVECWKEAKVLVNMVYEAINKSEKFKRDYRLRDQATAAAVSTMSNIAEGFSRQSNKEFIRFLYISKSSASEVQSIFYVALDQGYIERETFDKIYSQADKVSQIDSGFIKYLSKQRKNAKTQKRKNGFTLIELLIALSLAAILTGVVVLTLKTALDSYLIGQEEALLGKALDDVFNDVASGGFENYGVKDSLEILSATPQAITFVPFWIDDTQSPKPTRLTLNRPFKPGAPLPVGEVLTEKGWRPVPITFILGPHKDPLKPDDQVIFNDPIPAGAKIRIIFQPDASYFPDCALTIKWAGDRITRSYKNQTRTIPKYNIPGVTLKNLRFQYFDNSNSEIIPEPGSGMISKQLLSSITAVRFSLQAATKAKTKEGAIFINMRNTRSAGGRIIIRQGSRLRISDSSHIRVFSLSNLMGIKEGGIIEFEARPEKGTTWKIRIELAYKDKIPVLRKYSIEYPPGRTLYSETINLTTDLSLNFMALGANGRYDYDLDKDVQNVVNLKGKVELVVTRMDAAGAALFIRP
ncbi:four helix bundle protein [bacterium]|nr:four helix bundle protein [bacterium]